MRGLQNDDTASEFNNGFKAFYNYIRPHMALNGETPARAGGIDLKLGRNRWMGMIQKSVKNQENNGLKGSVINFAETIPMNISLYL